MFNTKSLRFKIPALIIILVMITIAGASYMSYEIFTQDIRHQIIQKNAVITEMISDQISQYLIAAQDTVEYVAKYASYNDMPSIKRSIDRIYGSYKWMDLMFYMTTDGKITYSNPHNDIIYQRDYVEREYFQHITKYKETYISKVFISSILNQPHIIIVSPIIDPQTGEMKGIIGGGVPLNSLQKIVEKTQQSFDGRIYVVDMDGTTLVSPNESDITNRVVLNRRVKISGEEQELSDIMERYTEGIGEYKSDLDRVYVSFSKIPNYKGLVIVEQNEQYILGQLGEIKSRFFSGIVFVMISVLILSMYFAHTITSPIENLVNFVRRLSSDIDSGTKEVEITASDELGELERAFHHMGRELSLKMEALKNLHKREYDIKKYLNNILKSAASGIIVIDYYNKISIFNTAAEEITGYRSQYFINKPLEFLASHIGFPLEIFKNYINGEENTVTERECLIKKNEGVMIPLSISLSPVYDDEGQVISTVCLIKDLTKIKVLEEHLRREDRLKTIGEMSSSIIHEIGNPLAGMSNLLEVLRDHVEDKNLRDELLTALSEEVNMLNNLVINFLDFTRTHKSLPITTNILGVINSALNILNSEIMNKNVNIVKKYSSSVPLVKIDPATVRQAFVNLLKNSVQAVDENGKITIEVKTVEEDYRRILCISILDNGEGISEDKIEQIFNPFYTTKQDGTGLGLAIVHKIIRDNNGTISVKSEVGASTEFIICFEGEIIDEAANY